MDLNPDRYTLDGCKCFQPTDGGDTNDSNKRQIFSLQSAAAMLHPADHTTSKNAN